jgi:hypothetical protein
MLYQNVRLALAALLGTKTDWYMLPRILLPGVPSELETYA